jgi:CBS domain containing-hemolysin-like protein
MAGSTWAIVAILILANSLYVAAEFGAVGVRRSRVRRMAEDGNWLARRLLPYVETPSTLDRYVGTSQIGITVSGLTLGAFAQATFALALAPVLTAHFDLAPVTAVSAAAVIVLVVLTAVQLVLGELVPKAIALQYPTETALATVLPMQWSLAVFRPVIKLLNGAALLLLRLFGADDHGTCTRRKRSTCSSPRAAMAACSSPRNSSACAARSSSDCARRAISSSRSIG